LEANTLVTLSLFHTRGLVEYDLHNICYWLKMSENDILYALQWAYFNAMENDRECWGKNKHWTIV